MFIVRQMRKLTCDFSSLIFFMANVITGFSLVAVLKPSLLTYVIGADNSMVFSQYPMLAGVILMLGVALQFVSALLRSACRTSGIVIERSRLVDCDGQEFSDNDSDSENADNHLHANAVHRKVVHSSITTQTATQASENAPAADPVDISKVPWTPVSQNTKALNHQALVDCDNGTIRVRATLTVFAWYAVVCIGGISIMLSSFTLGLTFAQVLIILIGIAMVGFAVKNIFSALSSMVFDQKRGQLVINGKATVDSSQLKKTLLLADIQAVQIVDDATDAHHGQDKSYELNIVFKDFTRLNVLDSGCPEMLAKQAFKLSTYLNVPVLSRKR